MSTVGGLRVTWPVGGGGGGGVSENFKLFGDFFLSEGARRVSVGDKTSESGKG